MRFAPSWVVPLWMALPGAACGYQAGSFTDHPFAERPFVFPGQRAQVGCLDIAVERRADMPIGPVLVYRFANRCDEPAIVDLSAVAVQARGADGAEHALIPYDPKHELKALWLDGRRIGKEAIAYDTADDAAQVCADVGPIARGDAIRGAAFPASWLCFGGPAVAEAAR